MSVIRVRAAALRDLGSHVREFAADLEAGVARLRSSFDALDWDDDVRRRTRDALAGPLDSLTAAAMAFLAATPGLDSLAARVELIGGAVVLAPVSPSPAGAASQVEPFARVRNLPEVVGAPPDRGFRLLDLRRHHADDFDWVVDHPAADLELSHHGNTAADYLALVRGYAAVDARLRTGEPLSTPEQQRCFAALFGDDPVLIERGSDGRIAIIDGRHRLWAALKLGAALPVRVA